MRFFILILYVLIFSNLSAFTIEIVDIHKGHTIKNSILKARSGDTLFIKAGVYNEADLIINKPLTLIGEKNAVIDGEGLGQILYINANHVNIRGLEFRNTPVSYMEDYSAVKLDSSFFCTISNNIFVNNFFAIYLARSANCTIENNHIRSISKRETASGNGIHLWYCKNITIKNNKIKSHRDGIYFEFVEDSEIHNNYSEQNLRYGLHFMFSNRCIYTNNVFKNNGAGVAVMYTKNVDMSHNEFIHNWGSAAYGLLLKEITDSEVYQNLFLKNSKGIYAESSNRINVYKNTFQQNGWAVKIMGNCLDNIFTKNNFLGNTFDVSTNSKHHFNKFISNFWDGYTGYDLDKDGVGDIPYRPVKLFSFLVEQNEPALILIRSFFVDIINLAETIIPTITPETLIDSEPAMRKYH
jgi:nitrous oxidase accessory protein